jgi:hypothetical protein
VRAALFERERLLIESLRFISEASHRRRLKIESELGDIRRKLQHLASQAQRNGARLPDRTPVEFRKDSSGKGAPIPNVTRVSPPDTKKKPQAPPSPITSALRSAGRHVCSRDDRCELQRHAFVEDRTV